MALLAMFVWGYIGFRALRPSGEGQPSAIEKEIMPEPGPPTAADEAVAAVMQAVGAQMLRNGSLWGVDQKEFKPTPKPQAAESFLAEDSALRAAILAKLGRELEAPGDDCLLNSRVNFRDARGLSYRLADDALCLLVTGKQGDSIRLMEAVHRFARLIGRGIEGYASLIARMICIAMQGSADRAVAMALQRHLFDASQLDSLDAVYVQALAREVGLDPSMKAELDMCERAVKALDRRMGPLAYALRFYWGDGLEQIARLRSAWEQHTPMPSGLEISKMHIMIQVGMPNCEAAQNRYLTRLSVRHGVRSAIALEKARIRGGAYPQEAPASIPDPVSGKPFLLKKTEKGVRLYGVGSDGKDHGGDPEKDAVVW